MNVDISFLTETARSPSKSKVNDAGWDLYADLPMGITVIPANEVRKVSTGFKLSIQDGWCAYIVPRSSGAMKMLDISGIIDSNYRGEVFVIIRNNGTSDIVIEHLERIAQILFLEVPQVDWFVRDRLLPSDRGEDGFGSSGRF